MRLIRLCHHVVRDSIERFNADDGWAIASHVALSTLMALFPFLIVLTALDAFVANVDLADTAAGLLLKIWPQEVSGRSWGLLRLESIAWVMVGAIACLALALPIVLAPLLFESARESAPSLARVELKFTLLRYAIAIFLLVFALVLVHKWLPAGRRRLTEIAPGVLVTLALWLTFGGIFGRYLADFAYTYVSYYAGLASGMIALSFLYAASLAFVFGGEINAACMRQRNAGVGSSAEG